MEQTQKKSRLQAAMYFIDDNLTVSNPIPDSSSARNMGLKRRHGICTAKPTFDMIGPLHVDVFNQSKYMLNGVTMKVRMTRSKDSFVLMAKSDVTESFKVDILSAKLFVRKLKITPSLCLAHERILQQKTAKYPITRVECKVIHLPQGQNSFTHDNLFLGQLPKRIVLGLVDNRAFNGDISLNPLQLSTLQFELFSGSLGQTTSSVGPVTAIIFRIELYTCLLHPIYWRRRNI